MATAAALVARARRQIQHHFFAADAVRADRAVPFDPANGFERRQFERMRRMGIVHEDTPGKYWMDVVTYDVDLRRRHRIRVTLLLILVAVLALMLMLGAFTVTQPATAASLAH